MLVSDRSILSYLRELAETSPDRLMLANDSLSLTADRLLRLTAAGGAALRRLLPDPAAPVAFRCGRSLESAVMLLSLRAAGLTAVLTDPHEAPLEVIAASEADIPVQAVIEQINGSLFRVLPCADGAAPGEVDLFAAENASAALPIPDAFAPAFVIFTSGSTGRSKAVVLSERNLVNNLLDSRTLGDYRDDDRALGALPMHHVFGLVLLAGIAVLGYSIFFPEKTDLPSLLSAIEQKRLTRMNGVPSLYLAMAEHCAEYDISSMRSGFLGGSPMTKEQFDYVEATLGMTLISVYGMSECIGIACSDYRASSALRSVSVGPFYSMNTGRILLEDGTDAAPMQEGEVCVTGPARMIGYYGQPLPPDELIHTGDIGYLDELGWLHLTGRMKNIIIRNGNNISPRRIEIALMAIPGVREAVVVGIPDEKQGEVPAAMLLVDRELDDISPAVAKNELPVLYSQVRTLPMTASGKPDRQTIRQMLIELLK